MSELRMWLVVRIDLDIPPGKLAAQAGHGFLSAFLDAQNKRPEALEPYMTNAQTKITVGVPDEEALLRVYREASEANLPCSIIRDAGRTFFAEPTTTVVGIGPCHREELPPFVKRLRLL